MVREEVAKALADDAARRGATEWRSMIDRQIAERIAQELDKVDWAKQLQGDGLQTALKRLAKGGSTSSLKPVDLSGIPTIEGKIARILEEFEGIRSYSHDNALVRQLLGLGEEAKPFLVAQLQATQQTPEDWCKRMAVTDALKTMLRPDDKAIILDAFEKSGSLAEKVREFDFQEAGDIALRGLSSPDGRSFLQFVDVALHFSEEKAVPILLQKMQDKARGVSVGMIAQKLDNVPGLDLREPLRQAAKQTTSTYDKQTLATLMLKRGMTEGIGMAADALASNEPHSEYMKEQVRSLIRNQFGITGPDQSMAQWLLDNRSRLRWNPTTGAFE